MKKQNLLAHLCLPVLLLLALPNHASAQPVLETGKDMPDEWIDKDTQHKIIRLSRKEGSSSSFYFHNNPFVGNKMVFFSTGNNGRQIYTVDLSTLNIEQVTQQQGPMLGEIVGPKSKAVFYQVKDSVWTTDLNSKKSRLLFVFPPDFKGSITTLNADETLLGGVWATDQEKEISKKYPAKGDYFNRIYEARLPRTLFFIDIKKQKLHKLFTDSAWLNHVQFSPTDPNLLMFCHEGPWHKVNRIWTIDINTGTILLMHKRTVDMEIAGHEWFGPDGKNIWFDLQMPRSVKFYVAGTDVKTLTEKRYELTRDEWSIHFTISPDQKLFAGDGGDSGQVAKAKNGRWIYLFHPDGDKFTSEKLVNMQYHTYRLEPNVHFSPDGKWVIFRANFEGREQIYAVEVAKAKG